MRLPYFQQLCILCLFLLTACPGEDTQQAESKRTERTAPQHGAVKNPQRMLRAQRSENFRVNYVPEPDPIPLNKHFRLRLQVQQADGQMLNSETAQQLKLQVDAQMPEHNHGMNVQPEIQRLGNGQYEVRGLLFHMAGYWEIQLRLNAGQKSEEILFGVELEHQATDPAAQPPHSGHGHSDS